MEEQLKECRFSPLINQRRELRPFDAFLCEQSRRQRSRDQKIAEMAETEARLQAALVQQVPTISPVRWPTLDAK